VCSQIALLYFILEFELARQSLDLLNYTAALFALAILEIGCYFLPRPAWTQSSYFTLPAIAGMTGVHHYSQIFSY
jgi:hypothetical protein